MKNFEVTYTKKDKPLKRYKMIVTQSNSFEARKWFKKKMHGQSYNIIAIKEV